MILQWPNKKFEMEENNILTNLPVDVLELIMKRLHLKDYLGLRATCRSCRKTVSNFIENKRCCHLHGLPLVFLKSKKSRFLYSLSTKSVHRIRTPQLGRNNKCLGSVEGWLIVGDFSEKGFAKFFFSNPVTEVRITIPSKLPLPSSAQCDGILPVRKMVASSNPNCDGSNCYLVGLFSNVHIAIYKPFDKSWTSVEQVKDSRTYFGDVEIIGTKLYVSDLSSDSILVYDLKDSINGPPKAEVLTKLPKKRPLESSHCSRYLAKDETLRKLYVIYMLFNGEYETRHVISDRLTICTSFVKPPQITIFKVFRLDMDKDPIGWQNVKLEDRVSFVSRYKSMVMSRDVLNCNKELIGGNSIYFADTFSCPINPWSGLELGMFCLTDSSIKYFPVEISNHGNVPYPLWFVPSLW